jgi:hypothetical protein
VRHRDIIRRRQQDAVSAGLGMREQAYAADRMGDLVRAIGWARAAVLALAGDRVLRHEAEQHLARLVERHEHEGGHAA